MWVILTSGMEQGGGIKAGWPIFRCIWKRKRNAFRRVCIVQCLYALTVCVWIPSGLCWSMSTQIRIITHQRAASEVDERYGRIYKEHASVLCAFIFLDRQTKCVGYLHFSLRHQASDCFERVLHYRPSWTFLLIWPTSGYKSVKRGRWVVEIRHTDSQS